MSNGNNNGHNRNGTGNGLVHASGNGHKPDAAIVTEHDLLWDGLSPAVTKALGQPIDPALVSQRKGRGGRVFDYLEGHVVIDQANRIFGSGGWGYELVENVTLRRIETVDSQTGEVTVSQAYSAPVRVTVTGALPRTDIGVHPVAEDTVDGHDTAIKAAVTDGMKRAFRSFGVQFGNDFYGDQPRRAPRSRSASPPQAKASGNGRQPQAGLQRESQPAGGNDAQAKRAAQPDLRDRRGAGHRRGPGARRRREEDGQEHRRPDGRRARAAGESRRQQAQAVEAGGGRIAGTDYRHSGARAVSLGELPRSLIYRTTRRSEMTTMTATYTPWGWTRTRRKIWPRASTESRRPGTAG